MSSQLTDFGGASDPLFCLDMANSHQGSVEHGINIITEVAAIAKRTEAYIAIKLQFRDFRTFLHPADRFPQVPDAEPLSRHTKRFNDTALTKREFGDLVRSARSCDVPVYATPFDEASVDLCEEFGFDVIKVASASAYDWPLLRRVAQTRRPVIVSLGGLEVNEVADVVDFFQSSGNPLALMHCVATYPAPVEDLQLDVIRQLKERFPDIVIGYSGHESPDDLDIAGLAVAKGAQLLERHVGLPTETNSLNAYSLSPDQAEQWVRSAQRAFAVCANGSPKRPVAGERESLLSLKRGIYARRTIPAGKTLTEEDVFLAMPCLEGQFSAAKLWELVGSFTPMEPIYAKMPVGLEVPDSLPRALVLSSIAARIQEMLEDAKIYLDPEAEVELSHQYGFERFFEVGAVIIDVMNREYCKKLVIQFPGQSHPSHHHLQKEETFQVLAGEVDIELPGKSLRLEAGQKQLVERGMPHAFSTRTGMIFEEVSTTHIKGDSIYEDQSIPSDPGPRKTAITLPS